MRASHRGCFRRPPSGESSQPAVLGYHYARAGNIPEAIEAWLQAGKSALRRSATKEAVAHLREGLSLISEAARFTAAGRG